jgi:TATA-box binding protein (TBP) (component of TFIID and TFIIIB)
MSELISGLDKAKLEAYNLPYDLPISTATITCKINVMFDVENIAYYFNDFDDIIIGKKYGNRVVNNLVNIKKLKLGKKKKRKEKKDFFNQVSLIFSTAMLMGLDPEKLTLKERFKNINVKLFINGSIQMTGCKHLNNITKCLEILFEKLYKTKAILNKDFKFEKKTFLKNVNNLDLTNLNFTYDLNKYKNDPYKHLKIQNVYMFDIHMINTNFNIGFQIKRDELRKLLIINGFDAILDPNVHACVNIKYNIPNLNKTVSIFVFESGSITIAGSNSCEQILYTYNFINKFILTNYKKLLSKPITPQLIIQLAQNI